MKEKKITKIKQKIINSSKELNCKSINFSKGITLIALVITIVSITNTSKCKYSNANRRKWNINKSK